MLLIISCNSGNKSNRYKNHKIKYLEAKYSPKSKIKLIYSLIFNNTNNKYIGTISDAEVIKNRIYISDNSLKCIHVLDKNLKYITKIGSSGRGPHEFSVAPILTKDHDTLVVFDTRNNKLIRYNKNYNESSEISLPRDYFYMKTKPIYTEHNIFLAAVNKIVRNLNANLDDYTTILILNRKGKVQANVCKLLDDYKSHKNMLYYARNDYDIISQGFGNTIIVKQLATNKFIVLNNKGKELKVVEYRPKYYKDPPSVKTSYQFKSMEEAMKKFYSKETYYHRMIYDKHLNFLYINYRSLHANEYKTRSFLDADNYLLVFNNKFQPIFDGKIPGYLLSVEDGFVYVLTGETEEEIVIDKLKLIPTNK